MVDKRKRVNSKPEGEMTNYTVNERILKMVHYTYTQGEMALRDIGEELGMSLKTPRKKITVMIVGNHSAGKSSFINWYTGETIQRTGVAIETSGFTIVTSGKKRETWKGQATLKFYEHLASLANFEGVLPCVETEICTSKERSFPLVDFIDTPGLTDGDLQYPYDVEGCIEWLGDHADLILVFFDPIGQALCARTMDVVERLNAHHPEKVKYFLSKADSVPIESDRQKVLIQITQNLTSRVKNQHAFDLPTIYIPTGHKSNVANAIDELCKEVDKTVAQSIQGNLNNLETDCQNIEARMREILDKDKETHRRNQQARKTAVFYLAASSAFLFPPFAYVLVKASEFCERYNVLSGQKLNAYATAWPRLFKFLQDVFQFSSDFVDATSDVRVYILLFSLAVFFLLFLVARLSWKTDSVLARKHKARFSEIQAHLKHVRKQRKQLYQQYFDQSKVNEMEE